MKVGDLVKAPYWDKDQVAVVIITKRLEHTGIVKVFGSFGWELDQESRHLEIISEVTLQMCSHAYYLYVSTEAHDGV